MVSQLYFFTKTRVSFKLLLGCVILFNHLSVSNIRKTDDGLSETCVFIINKVVKPYQGVCYNLSKHQI